MTDDLRDLNSRLKQSAENFSLTPSPGVWQNVEREISRNKRKQRAFIWLLTGVAVLIASGLWLTRSGNHNEVLVSNNQIEAVETIASVDNEGTNSPVQIKGAEVVIPSDVTTPDNTEGQMTAAQKTPLPVTDKIDPLIHGPTREQMEEQPFIIRQQPDREKIVAEPENDQSNPVHLSGAEPIHESEPESLQLTNDNDTPAGAVLPLVVADSLIVSENDTNVAEPSRFSLAVGVSPSLSFTSITERGNNHGVSGYRNSTDKDLAALNAHLNVSYSLLPRLDIYSGISLTNYREDIRSQQTVYRYDTGPVTGPVPPPVVVREENYLISDAEYVTNSLTYIGVPLGIRYNVFPCNRFNIWLRSEAAYNRLIHFNGYVYDDNMGIYRSMSAADLQPWKISYGFAIVVQQNLSSNLELEVSPAYRIFTGSVYQSTNLLSQKFAQADLQFALRYSFGK